MTQLYFAGIMQPLAPAGSTSFGPAPWRLAGAPLERSLIAFPAGPACMANGKRGGGPGVARHGSRRAGRHRRDIPGAGGPPSLHQLRAINKTKTRRFFPGRHAQRSRSSAAATLLATRNPCPSPLLLSPVRTVPRAPEHNTSFTFPTPGKSWLELFKIAVRMHVGFSPQIPPPCSLTWQVPPRQRKTCLRLLPALHARRQVHNVTGAMVWAASPLKQRRSAQLPVSGDLQLRVACMVLCNCVACLLALCCFFAMAASDLVHVIMRRH